MKSLAELKAIRDKMQSKIVLRKGIAQKRVVVGMATCGIAAGARPVLGAFVEQVNDKDLAASVTVTQTGCVGLCQLEPIVEVYEEGKDKVTYVNMTVDKVARVVDEHLIGGKPVEEYTISNQETN